MAAFGVRAFKEVIKVKIADMTGVLQEQGKYQECTQEKGHRRFKGKHLETSESSQETPPC